MIYTTSTVGATNPVKAMFGLVKQKDVERVIEEGREAVSASNVENFEAEQKEFVDFINEATRPKKKKKPKAKHEVAVAPAP